MKTKKIINIVFYKYFDKEGEKKQACIFYRDGSASLVSYEEGIDACEEVVKQRKITSKNAFKEMINREIVHVISGEEFVNNFNRYKSHDPLDYEIIDEAVEEELETVEATTTPVNIEELEERNNDFIEEEDNQLKKEYENNNIIIPTIIEKDNIMSVEEKIKSKEIESENNDKDDNSEIEEDEIIEDEVIEDDEEVVDKTKKQRPIHANDGDVYIWDDNDDYYDDDYDDDYDDELFETNQKEEEPKGIIGFFKRQIKKIKESKLVSRITAVVVTLAIGLGLYSCTTRKTAIGQMFNSNLGNNSRTLDDLDLEEETAKEEETEKTTQKQEVKYDGTVMTNDNSFYDGYTFEQLQEVTNNATQKQAMKNVYDALIGFNKTFADAHVENGKDIRAALSFEEVIALQQAYNDYSKEEIRAIFNGEDVDASRLSRAYKDATLQLMGAYVIETSENPVDMSMLIESEEGKEFYQRYHQMFLAAKEATGDEQLEKIREFYEAVRKDFPITNEVRTEGIAHADAYSSVMEGKGGAGPAVAPMIAAAEIMWQNYKEDLTLDNTQIDFLNDIGLCNLVDEKFEKIEVITLGSCEEDTTNPTYHQYKVVIIQKLKEMQVYVIDDSHRELTKLDAFQKAVNWHFKETGEWVYSGGFYDETTTYTETKTWTESETTYREEETRVRKPIPKEEKDKIDEEIRKENEEEKKKAEEKAKEEQKRMQEEEDKKAEQLEEEIKKDEEDLQEKIDDANDQIEENQDDDPTNDKPINEDDLGHGVDFDDDHSDSEGNLDDSVENITTDPTGDQTDEPLPDPEVTGAEFDANAPEDRPFPEPNYEEESLERTVEPEDVEEQISYRESEVQETPVVQYEEVVLDDGSGYYEEIVDDYVESLADEPVEEEAYEYSL